MSTLGVLKTSLPDLQGSSWRKDPFKHAGFLSSTSLGPVAAAGTGDVNPDHTLGRIQIEASAANVHAKCEVLKAMRDLLSKQTANAVKQAQAQQQQRQQQQAQPLKTRAAKTPAQGRQVPGSQHADGTKLFQASVAMAQLCECLNNGTAALWPKAWELKQPVTPDVSIATVDPAACCKQPGFSQLLTRIDMDLDVRELTSRLSENIATNHSCSQALCSILDRHFAKGVREADGHQRNDTELRTSQLANDTWQDDDCWSDEEVIQEGLLEQIPLPSYLRGHELPGPDQVKHLHQPDQRNNTGASRRQQAVEQLDVDNSKKPVTAIAHNAQFNPDIDNIGVRKLTAVAAIANDEHLECNANPTTTGDKDTQPEIRQVEQTLATVQQASQRLHSTGCDDDLISEGNVGEVFNQVQYLHGNDGCDDVVPCSLDGNHAMRNKAELQALLDSSGNRMEIVYSDDDIPGSSQHKQHVDYKATIAGSEMIDDSRTVANCDAMETDQLLDMLSLPITTNNKPLLHHGGTQPSLHARFKQKALLTEHDKQASEEQPHMGTEPGVIYLSNGSGALVENPAVTNQQAADLQQGQQGANAPRKPAVMMRRAKYGAGNIIRHVSSNQQPTDVQNDATELVDDIEQPDTRVHAPGHGATLDGQQQHANLRKPNLRKRRTLLATTLAGPLPLQLSKYAQDGSADVQLRKPAVPLQDNIEDSDGMVTDCDQGNSDGEDTRVIEEQKLGDTAFKPIPRAVTIGRRRALLVSSQMAYGMSQGGTAVNNKEDSNDHDDSDTGDALVPNNDSETGTETAPNASRAHRPTKRAQLLASLKVNSTRDESQYMYMPDLSAGNLQKCDVAGSLQALQQDKKIRCRPVHNPSLLLNKPLSLPSMHAITRRAHTAMNPNSTNQAPDPQMVTALADVTNLLKAALGEAALSQLPVWPPQPAQPPRPTLIYNQQQQQHQVSTGIGNPSGLSIVGMQQSGTVPMSASNGVKPTGNAWQAPPQDELLDEEDEEFWLAIDAAAEAARGKSMQQTNSSNRQASEQHAQTGKHMGSTPACHDIAGGPHWVALSPQPMHAPVHHTAQQSSNPTSGNINSAGDTSLVHGTNHSAAGISCQRYSGKQQRKSGGRVWSGAAAPIVSALDQLQHQGSSLVTQSAPHNVNNTTNTAAGSRHMGGGGFNDSNISKRMRHSVQVLDDMFEMLDGSIHPEDPDQRQQQHVVNDVMPDPRCNLDPSYFDHNAVQTNSMGRSYQAAPAPPCDSFPQQFFGMGRPTDTDVHTGCIPAAAITNGSARNHMPALYATENTGELMDVDVDWGDDCSPGGVDASADDGLENHEHPEPNSNSCSGPRLSTVQPTQRNTIETGMDTEKPVCMYEHEPVAHHEQHQAGQQLIHTEETHSADPSKMQSPSATRRPPGHELRLHDAAYSPPHHQQTHAYQNISKHDSLHKDKSVLLSSESNVAKDTEGNDVSNTDVTATAEALSNATDNNIHQRTAATRTAIRDLLAFDGDSGLPVCDIQFDGFDDESETALHAAAETAIGNMTDKQLLAAAAKMQVGRSNDDWAAILPTCELVDWDIVEDLATENSLHAPDATTNTASPVEHVNGFEDFPAPKRHCHGTSPSQINSAKLANADNPNDNIAAYNTATVKDTNLAAATGGLARTNSNSNPVHGIETAVVAGQQPVQRKTVMSAREALKQRLVQEVLRLHRRSKVDLGALMNYLATTLATKVTTHMQHAETPTGITHDRHNGIHPTTASTDTRGMDTDLVKVDWEGVVSAALANKSQLFGQQEVTPQRLFLALLGLAHQNNTAVAQQATDKQGGNMGMASGAKLWIPGVKIQLHHSNDTHAALSEHGRRLIVHLLL